MNFIVRYQNYKSVNWIEMRIKAETKEEALLSAAKYFGFQTTIDNPYYWFDPYRMFVKVECSLDI